MPPLHPVLLSRERKPALATDDPLTVSMPFPLVTRQAGTQPGEERCFKRKWLETLPDDISGG
jgi:hypothetical protein